MKQNLDNEANDKAERIPRGRGRAQSKSPSEKLQEERAKGHLHDEHPATPAMNTVTHDINEVERNRGHQQGYGKNQQDPGNVKKGAHSSKSNGAEAAEGNARGIVGNQQVK